jgi:hypothetical protein
METKYEFKGLRWPNDFKMSKEDFDSCMQMCQQFYTLNRIYSKKDIEQISKQIGFDFEELYYFSEYKNGILKEGQSIKLPAISIAYRFISPIPNQESEIISLFEKFVDPEKIYKRTEIENLSMKAGFSVWDRSQWETYSLITESGIQYVKPVKRT